MYATYGVGGYWHVIRIEQGTATFVAAMSDHRTAERIATLLERNGMADVPLTALDGTTG